MIPNVQRVLIKPVPIKDLQTAGGIVLPGQLKVGENLLYGEIYHPGTTKFHKGQGVFYSEYSAAAILDVKPVLNGDVSHLNSKEDGLVVVAEDDIMAYYDDSEIPTTPKKD